MKTIICIATILLVAPVVADPKHKDPGIKAFEQKNFSSAFAHWLPAAKNGDVNAQFNLGYMYERGLGTARNNDKAQNWYEMASRQGNPEAQHRLASLYYDQGKYEVAVSLYRKASEQGLAEAQADLGASYGLGQGVPQSYIYAHMWSHISSLNGFDKGIRLTTGLAEFMSPSEISIAQYLARECVASSFKECLSLSDSNVLLAVK